MRGLRSNTYTQHFTSVKCRTISHLQSKYFLAFNNLVLFFGTADQVGQSHVAFTLATDVTGQGVHVVLTSVDAVGINLGDSNLHRGVVLGRKDAVGPRALAGDVDINVLASFVLHLGRSGEQFTNGPLSMPNGLRNLYYLIY
ncbi:hypothetical protein Ae201684P_017063 [Aphanomyces euteiches]|uniref:Uncharacterized protein n=1 Tax=Aphanomyces euteiches TaxID=100861 RepID=A0A6G0XI53_9STRA|nr:hypothetical protein Ae201684_004626 [Aphanomyces euteiches]KAH9094457.1 hypothetical protein Ae201684P_017063 [Aphanomyces euteiches]